MRGKALMVVHQRLSYPGRVGRLVMERGYCLDIRCPNLGHVLPERLDDYAAVFMFGGPMSANDCHMPGIRTELDWMPKVLDQQKPFVGICLGGQILARVLGGRVTPHPEGCVEIGYTTITPTAEGAACFDRPMQVYQWHSEGFDCPRGATLLAEGQRFRNQAFRYGPAAYAFQFHPEVTREMMEKWTVHAAHKLGLPGAMSREEQLGLQPLHDPPFDTWIRCFLDRLFAGYEGGITAAAA